MEVTIRKNKITVLHNKLVTEFTNLDKAWDFVEDEYGISSIEVDFAIVQMASNAHNKAHFDAKSFVRSEQI